jgi:serine/threonine protein kinase
VAVKILEKEKIAKWNAQKMIEYEIDFFTKKWEKISHTNIIKCFGHYEDAKLHYLVLEHCATDLEKIMKIEKVLEEDRAQQLFRQLVFAIQKLHSH